MKGLYVAVVVGGVLVLRLFLFRARRRRRRAVGDGDAEPDRAIAQPKPHVRSARWDTLEHSLGDVGLVAGREIRERVRGRIFRVGTLIMLVAVGAIVVIPTLQKSNGLTKQTVGVVGGLSSEARQVVLAAAKANQDRVTFVTEASETKAKAALRAQQIDLAIVDNDSILVDQPVNASNSPADGALVLETAQYLGVLRTYQQAGLTAAQASAVNHAEPVAVHNLVPGGKSGARTSSVIGLVLLFFMLTQYCTWILIGVMQEKSSRVVEVLLAVVRPLQLLGGKVVGIGLVALGQAALIVGFALALGAGVGSNLLHGAGPMALLAEFVWLVLGYAFYCWVYAAAGSTAERQDQVQTLALPLSLPILFGYIYSITVASSGHANLFFKVLAYVPLTAPFCMSVLVGLSDVAWWQFVASVLISLTATAGMALVAARIYERAVLRTGRRVRVRELLGGTARG